MCINQQKIRSGERKIKTKKEKRKKAYLDQPIKGVM
jgi:hypothetical protein